MTTATLQLNDARLRGQIVNSMVEIVRNELDRNANSVAVLCYWGLAQYQFTRFRAALENAPTVELRDPTLAHLGETLAKQADRLTIALRRCHHMRHALRLPERYALDRVGSLASNLHAYGIELQERAARGARPLVSVSPKLSGRLAYQAGMASLFMRPAARDRAEASPDPDYGI